MSQQKSKPGRNNPCPCGSGRKFKRCCYGGPVGRQSTAVSQSVIVSPIPPQRVLDAFLDHERKVAVVVSNDFLIQTLRRDCPEIANHFDEDFAEELQELNDQFCQVMAIWIRAWHLDKAVQPPEVRMAIFLLLSNAAQTFIAALELLRHGFRLQPGILIRGLIENLTTVCHLGQRPQDLAAIQSGKLSSTDTLAAAKRVIPIFGPLYGLFSDTFVHVSQCHFDFNPVVRCSATDEAVTANFSFLRMGVWLLYVVIELAFFPEVDRHRYWHVVDHPAGRAAYVYRPSDEEEKWRVEFLSKWDRKENPTVAP